MAIPKPKTPKKRPSKATTSVPWNAPKIVINVHTHDSKKSEEDGGEKETVTFFILHEVEEDKVERKISSPRKKKKSESIFMTQDEGDLVVACSDEIIVYNFLFLTACRRREFPCNHSHSEHCSGWRSLYSSYTWVSLHAEFILLCDNQEPLHNNHSIRVNFLDHLEFWKRECIKIANQIVAEKVLFLYHCSY